MARGDAGSPGSAQDAVMPGARGPGLGEAVDDLQAIASDRCAALVAPQIERLTFAVIHASIKRAGPRLATYGVPPEAIDIVGQLRTGLAARPVSAAGLAAVIATATRARSAATSTPSRVRESSNGPATARSGRPTPAGPCSP